MRATRRPPDRRPPDRRPPDRRLLDRRLLDWRLWLAVVAATALAMTAAVPLPDALVIAAAVLAAGLVVPLLDAGQDAPWPRPESPGQDGRRVDVARLTWSLAGRDGKVSEAAMRRLRAVAEVRLARAGLPLAAGFVGPTDATGEAERVAARSVLGSRAWSVLTATSSRLPTIADVAVCVRALEQVLDAPASDAVATADAAPAAVRDQTHPQREDADGRP